MIREERDGAFWRDIAAHPACAGAVMGLDPDAVAQAAGRAAVIPLASDNGGFIFCPMDGIGMVVELHTLYRPAGWGREVFRAAQEACEWVFRTHQLIVTYEMETNPHSRPPRSFGFARAGEWQKTVVGSLRAWVLTRAAWEASAAHRRFVTCQ